MARHLSSRVFWLTFFAAAAVLILSAPAGVAAADWSEDWGYFQCSKHGHNDTATCYDGALEFIPAGYAQYGTSITLTGHRHGGSAISATVCLRSTYNWSNGICWNWSGEGSNLGDELGDIHNLFFYLASGSLDTGAPICGGGDDGGEPPPQEVRIFIPRVLAACFPPSGDWGSSPVAVTAELYVKDAEARVSGTAWANAPQTKPPRTHFECRNNACAWVEGDADNQCSVDADCITSSPPSYAFDLSGSCSVEGDSNRASLSWSSSAGASKYRVERRTWSTGQWRQAGETTATSFAELLRNDEDYYYRVYAVRADGGETLSNPNELFVCGAVSEESHRECRNNACVEVGGSGQNSCSTNADCAPPGNSPSVSISCSPSTILYGNSGIVSWSSQNVTACTVSPGGWNGTSGSQSTGAITQNTTYTATCTVGGSGGQRVCELKNSKGVRGSGNCVSWRGSTSSLSSASQCASWCGTNNAGACEWDINNEICYWYTGDNSCYLIDVGGWMADAQCAVRQGGSQNTVSQSCTFSIAQSHNICTQDGACVQISGAGPNECSDPGTPDSLNCPQPPPSCSAFNADPEKFPYPPAKSVTLSWTCTKAHNGCSISPGSLIKGGGQNLPQFGSVQTLPLTQTTDFVLRCQGRGGTSPDYHLPLGTLRVYQFVGGRLKEVSPLGQ